MKKKRKSGKYSEIPDEQLAFLNEERRKHLNGESKSYSWEEVKNMIRTKKYGNTSDAGKAY